MQPLPIESILPSLYGIIPAPIDGTITARPQEKSLENFFNNPECEVLIASISAVGTALNITCANMVYLMVRDPKNSTFLDTYIQISRRPIGTQPLSLRLLISSIVLANNNL
ncbi:hypothetical protein O181_068371 [Austropuccinia psidii MF-1]|uniref:Helicase C-terminal domain-containing protein n=1 Tax=Austropuccinia psidii MF-1 TaxID=1389203 RepID=A0A9Q3I3V6_9BASI|nr:hypothetical protein [Austropuccinia psidii MF-1]